MPQTTAETIARALAGHRTGAQWMARCPAHEDKTPSLSVRDAENGRVLVHCHAGCSQHDVIAALTDRGLWPASTRLGRQPVVAQTVPTVRDDTADDKKPRDYALRRWLEAGPPEGSPVEAYLSSRGLNVAIPPTLKYHPALIHRSGGRWPAMVGLVTHGAKAIKVGIHRTYLRTDGTDKAPIKPQKMMLGSCSGGAVRLSDASSPLLIGEGIETTLSVMQATGFPAWAALSAPGIAALDLPPEFRDLILLADGDAPGERAVRQAAARWQREGRRVRIARAPQGQDFNDLLRPSGSIGDAVSP